MVSEMLLSHFRWKETLAELPQRDLALFEWGALALSDAAQQLSPTAKKTSSLGLPVV